MRRRVAKPLTPPPVGKVRRSMLLGYTLDIRRYLIVVPDLSARRWNS